MMRFQSIFLALAAVSGIYAQSAAPGEAVFESNCAMCRDGHMWRRETRTCASTYHIQSMNAGSVTLAVRLAVLLLTIPSVLIGGSAASSITLGSSPNLEV
jgi:hypothetical protein